MSKEAKAEQPSASFFGDKNGSPRGVLTRYTFPIHVDAVSLHSVVHAAPQLPQYDMEGIGYVNVLDCHWGDLDPEDQDEGEEPVEGCRLYDVGQMKAGLSVLCLRFIRIFLSTITGTSTSSDRQRCGCKLYALLLYFFRSSITIPRK